MVKNAGSKNKCGRLMKNMKSPNSGLTLNDVLRDRLICDLQSESTQRRLLAIKN